MSIVEFQDFKGVKECLCLSQVVISELFLNSRSFFLSVSKSVYSASFFFNLFCSKSFFFSYKANLDAPTKILASEKLIGR